MLPNRRGTLTCATALFLLIACGEEVPRPPPEKAERLLTGHSCDLVSASELSQLFVSKLTPVRDMPAGHAACTWKAADSGDAVFRYEIRPYVDDLEAGVREFAAGDSGELNVEVRPGLGEAAVWSNIGLFVSRNGRTLQLTPFDPEIPRAIYEELASLLLERLEAGR